jgi:hypothetical protein
MKKCTSVLTVVCLLFLSFVLNSCIKDTVTRTYTYTLFRPVYKTTAEVRANIKSNASVAVKQPGKLFIKGGYIFLNEPEKGVHIIDNSNPAQPKNVAFIDIPGNVDIAVKGNTLYADLYTDLVAIDITDPLDAKVTKVIEDVFPHRYWSAFYGVMDTNLIVTDWVVKDTTITEEYATVAWQRLDGGWGVLENAVGDRTLVFSASFSGAKAAASPAGMGGSMARFTIVDERLYTVGEQELTVFNIANTKTPQYVTENQIGFGIETIFPFKDKLFVGSNAGMFIYNISNPDQPVKLSEFTHVRSCDPVIADDNNAYVTLRSGTICQGFTNQLEVLNITNLAQPFLIKTYPMTNPHGLSKDGDLLFICDGVDGLKLYNAAKPDSLQLLKTISGLETYDVIAYDGLAIVVAKDGLYQFDYTDAANIKQLSKITLAN